MARASTRTARFWGESESGQCQYANGYDAPLSCSDGYGNRAAPVGSFESNAFGLYDVLGNVSEWTQDCLNESYAGAPADGSAWQSGDCAGRIIRGASWRHRPEFLRSAHRNGLTADSRHDDLGFRVARPLN